MEWISIDEGLPENNTLCWVHVKNAGTIIRLYKNDSFGLRDLDFEVSHWAQAIGTRPPSLESLYHKPESTSLKRDHKDAYSSELSLNLVR